MLSPKDFVRDSSAMSRVWPLEGALAYTKWIATGHYENFHVVSFLLPKHLHQDFYNVYAFCRWADDLGDEGLGAHDVEGGDAQEAGRVVDACGFFFCCVGKGFFFSVPTRSSLLPFGKRGKLTPLEPIIYISAVLSLSCAVC